MFYEDARAFGVKTWAWLKKKVKKTKELARFFQVCVIRLVWCRGGLRRTPSRTGYGEAAAVLAAVY